MKTLNDRESKLVKITEGQSMIPESENENELEKSQTSTQVKSQSRGVSTRQGESHEDDST